MIGAKEKAKELVKNFYSPIDYNLVGLFSVKNTVAKKCALIAVDEILNDYYASSPFEFEVEKKYWQEVKQEILAS
jgi:hypothetical protein